MSTSESTDRIEKQILLRASRERVWRALTDSQQFGSWFGVALSEPFTRGVAVSGKRVASVVDPEGKGAGGGGGGGIGGGGVTWRSWWRRSCRRGGLRFGGIRSRMTWVWTTRVSR